MRAADQPLERVERSAILGAVAPLDGCEEVEGSEEVPIEGLDPPQGTLPRKPGKASCLLGLAIRDGREYLSSKSTATRGAR